MDSNILDELLNKIKSLEEKNVLLRSQIDEVKVQLKENKRDRLESMDGGENIEDQMIVDDENNSTNLQLKDKLNSPSDTDLQNFKNITITYVPYEQYNSLWIMGDFNNWDAQPMYKYKDVFSFNVVLVKGYKYYFAFSSKDQMVIDYNQDYEQNPRSSAVNNFIDLKSDALVESIPFNFQKDSGLLKQAKKNFTRAKFGNNMERLLFESMVEFSGKYISRLQYLDSKREETLMKLNKFYEGKTEKIKKSEVNNFKNLCEVFKNRIIEKNNIQYLIQSIDLEKNVIKVMKLYDDNGIKINLDYYFKKNLLISINFSDLDKNFKILSGEQSKDIFQSHQADNKNILKILYKLDSSDSNVQMEGIVYFRAYGKKLIVEKILPEEIDTSKYDIDISGNMIHDVKNKTDNLKVIFITEEVKEEVDLTPSSLKIYYSLINKSVNILHIHRIDENLKINNLEAIILDRSEDVSKYKNFSNGSSLKILFKNYKINKVFLSSEDNSSIFELRAEELCIKNERIMQINSEGAYKNFYAKIKNIPNYLLTSGQIPEKYFIPVPTNEIKFSVSNCTFELGSPRIEKIPNISAFDYSDPNKSNSVMFEKFDVCTSPIVNDSLSGYVDLSLIFDNEEKFIDIPIEISLPVCFLSLVPVNKEMELEKIYSNERLKRKSVERLFDIYKDVSSNYEKFLSNLEMINSLTKEEIQNILTKLEEYKTSLSSIGVYIEQKELWTYLEKLCILESTIISLCDLLNSKLVSL